MVESLTYWARPSVRIRFSRSWAYFCWSSIAAWASIAILFSIPVSISGVMLQEIAFNRLLLVF